VTRFALCATGIVASLFFSGITQASRVTILDDGEKVARDPARALPPSPWPEPGDVELFALKDETVALQVVVEPDRDRAMRSVRVALGALGNSHARVESFAERFIDIKRPSGNDHEAGSLAFTAKAAPARDAFVGFFADPLVPGDASAGPHERAAVWVDITIPPDAFAGTYAAPLTLFVDDELVASRTVHLRVLDRALPYPGAATMVYYDPLTLEKRMGDRRAERSLRQMFHAHRLSAIHEITAATAMTLDDEALSGALFTRENGYEGPGLGVGEGVIALGAYGAFGDPKKESVNAVTSLADHLHERGVFERTQSFVYAVDEKCQSPRGRAWRKLLRDEPRARGVRVGVTCSDPPSLQGADLVMMTSDAFHPKEVAPVAADGKWIWVYNGIRPSAGPMMLDVPATDLRANGWISARYKVPRWFYWESTFWLDDNKGGKGGAHGFDPFEVAETFHNQDGDHANGDGILVYPGTQNVPGMRDERLAAVFGSVRLKNVRRGIEDAGYIALARATDAEAADAVVARMIPRALALAGDRVAWPERGAAWLSARRDLADIIEGKKTERRARVGCAGCTVSPPSSPASAEPHSAGGFVALLFVMSVWRKRSSARARRCSSLLEAEEASA
jgi:hypothetical protein